MSIKDLSRTSAAQGRLGRRRFLRLGAAGAVGLVAAPHVALAGTSKAKALSLYNLHTGEWADTEFWIEGQPVPEGLQEINRVLRDHRTGEATAIDPRLLHLLHALRRRLHARQAFHVISGYRSPATNAKLREKSTGVAKKSYHTRGMAIDIALPGCELRELRRAALDLHAGGVGFYPRPGFVHVDTGPVRHWS